MKYLSICSGIEAATVAWHPLGWQPVAYSEIEPFPCALLAHYYPTVPNWGDMTRFQEWPNAAIDLLVGGTPCQSFSVAGLRKGLADPRGNLVLTYLAIAARYKPAWLVWENVPGVLSSVSHDAPDPSPPPPPMDVELDGQELETEDEYTAEELHALCCFLAGLQELGYGFSLGVRDAQYFGVAQRRRRVFVVGHLGDWRRAAAVLFERESLSGNPAPRRESRERVAATLTRGAESSGRGGYVGRRQEDDVNIVPALTNMGHHGYPSDRGDGAHLLPEWPAEVAPTLGTAWADRHPGSSMQDFVSQKGGLFVPEVVGALSDGAHMGGGLTDRMPILGELSLCLNAGAMGRIDAESETLIPERTGGVFDDVLTLAIRGRGDSHELETRADGTANASEGEVMGTMAGCDHHNRRPSLREGMQVRRLTPRECERLQGFEDDYTLIPYNGKPAKDGPRYKALGNSMAVPCMRWIGERIELVCRVAPCITSSAGAAREDR